MILALRGSIHRFLAALGLAAVLAHAALAGAESARPVVTAEIAEQGPSWPTLTSAQRGALAPLQAEWPSIDAPRKQKWLELASRFQSMSADERSRVQVRMGEWVRMSPAERGRARLQFQETRQLSPQDRQSRWEAYQALPPAERNALAAKGAPSPLPERAARPVRADAGTPVDTPKRNLVTTTPQATTNKAVAPTVVQAAPGATTTLMSKAASPPLHHQPGLPKIAATKGFVDPATLLPTRGPQGAAIAGAPTASGARPLQR
jgi:Protein of unknown function (DUF3106)